MRAYKDPTADQAIENVMREERAKKALEKIRFEKAKRRRAADEVTGGEQREEKQRHVSE